MQTEVKAVDLPRALQPTFELFDKVGNGLVGQRATGKAPATDDRHGIEVDAFIVRGLEKGSHVAIAFAQPRDNFFPFIEAKLPKGLNGGEDRCKVTGLLADVGNCD